MKWYLCTLIKFFDSKTKATDVEHAMTRFALFTTIFMFNTWQLARKRRFICQLSHIQMENCMCEQNGEQSIYVFRWSSLTSFVKKIKLSTTELKLNVEKFSGINLPLEFKISVHLFDYSLLLRLTIQYCLYHYYGQCLLCYSQSIITISINY